MGPFLVLVASDGPISVRLAPLWHQFFGLTLCHLLSDSHYSAHIGPIFTFARSTPPLLSPRSNRTRPACARTAPRLSLIVATTVTIATHYSFLLCHRCYKPSVLSFFATSSEPSASLLRAQQPCRQTRNFPGTLRPQHRSYGSTTHGAGPVRLLPQTL